MAYTYPVLTSPTATASSSDVHAFLAQPTLIARRLQELLDESKFITYYLLAGRFTATASGAIAYGVADDSTPRSGVETVAPGAEYPLVTLTPEQVRIMALLKRGDSTELTDEAITQRGASEMERGFTFLVNSLIRDFDTMGIAAITSSVTKTVGALAPWTDEKGAAQMLKDVLRAKAQAPDAYTLNTLVLPELMYADAMPMVLPLLPRESLFMTDGGWSALAGIDIVTTPFASSLTTPLLVDRNALGGIAKAEIVSPGYQKIGEISEVKSFRTEDRDGWRLQARNTNLPVVTNPGAGVFITGTGLGA